MNTDAKILDQNPVPGSQVAPSAPVGVANKEVEPIPSVVPEIRPAGPEVKHEISQESAGLGVKEVQNRPDLTNTTDIQHAGPSVPIPPGPTGLVQISEKKDISNSGTWLNTLTEKVEKVLRLLGV